MKAFGMDEATMFISYSVTDGFAQVRFPLILATTVTMTSEKRTKKTNKKHEGIQQTHFTYTDMWLYTDDLLVCTCQRLTLRRSADSFI